MTEDDAGGSMSCARWDALLRSGIKREDIPDEWTKDHRREAGDGRPTTNDPAPAGSKARNYYLTSRLRYFAEFGQHPQVIVPRSLLVEAMSELQRDDWPKFCDAIGFSTPETGELAPVEHVTQEVKRWLSDSHDLWEIQNPNPVDFGGQA